MFVIVCKTSRCVKMTFSQDPRVVMNLRPNILDDFDIIEFPNESIDTYQGKFLKVIDNNLVDLGYVAELEKLGKIDDCGNCPPIGR